MGEGREGDREGEIEREEKRGDGKRREWEGKTKTKIESCLFNIHVLSCGFSLTVFGLE